VLAAATACSGACSMGSLEGSAADDTDDCAPQVRRLRVVVARKLRELTAQLRDDSMQTCHLAARAHDRASVLGNTGGREAVLFDKHS